MNKQKISAVGILVLLLLFASSCKTDLGDVINRLNNHESRLKLLEEKMKSANTEIGKLDGLIKAQTGKISIVSYKELADKSGYELTMSDDSKIILKNGKDGDIPVVGVKKHTDGHLYWTLNGEFMKDADGKIIKAQPSDGRTPTLRVNASNHWEMSLDGGKTWQAILGTDGKPVSATGKPGTDATVQLEITETEDAVIIKYNGVTFTVPKKKTEEPARPKLPIEYVAEYNINTAGDGFATDHNNKSAGLFNWYEASGITHEKFNPTGKNIFANGTFKDKYYLASELEWRVVIPDIIVDWDDREKIKTGIKEKIMVAGNTVEYSGDYNLKTPQTCYAIRFKEGNGDKYRCAYRYQYAKDPLDTDSKKKMRGVVTVRYLGAEGKSVTLEDVAKPEYWTDSNAEYVTRVFPLAGHAYHSDGRDKVYRRGERGYYWTSTEHPGNTNITEEQRKLYAIFFGVFEAHFDLTENGFYLKERYTALRPFIR